LRRKDIELLVIGLVGKAAEMAKVFARGGFHVFWGVVVSTLVSAAGVIVLARVLQPQNYGLYTIALAAPNLIGTFRDWGMNSAMIKYTAQYSAEEKIDRARGILFSGLVFEVTLGLALSFLSFFLSGFIANDIFRRPITALIQISSFSVLAGALLNAAQAGFTGREQLMPSSVTIVLAALFRSILSPVLVFLGLGVSGAVIGYTVGVLGGGTVGTILLLEIFHSLGEKRAGSVGGENWTVWKTMKSMFRYALPLSISSIFNSFLAQFYNFIIAIYASNFIIGNYAVASNFTVLLTFFTVPIGTMLFPAFSKLDVARDRETLKEIFQSSIKYSSLLVVPSTFALIALANPIVSVLFGEKYSSAPLFLALLAASYLLTLIGQLTTLNLISGQGETRLYLNLAIVNMVVGIVMAVFLVPTLGVIGLIMTMIFDGVPGLLVSLKWIKSHYGATVDWVSSTKILASSGATAAVTYFALSILGLSSWAGLLLGLVIFAGLFLLIAILVRLLKEVDFVNFRVMSSGLGPLRGVVNKILWFLERIFLQLS